MSTDNATTKPDGGASVSTAELGGDFTMTTLSLTNEEPWAVVSPTGGLTRFDGQTCRRLADEFDPDARLDQNKAIARLCVALLNEAAQEVDHILREGGGTYGDAIRRLTLTTPNVTANQPRQGFAENMTNVLAVRLSRLLGVRRCNEPRNFNSF